MTEPTPVEGPQELGLLALQHLDAVMRKMSTLMRSTSKDIKPKDRIDAAKTCTAAAAQALQYSYPRLSANSQTITDVARLLPQVGGMSDELVESLRNRQGEIAGQMKALGNRARRWNGKAQAVIDEYTGGKPRELTG